MLIDLKFNRHFAIKARASLHNIIHTPAIICRRSLLCIISYNAYKYQTVCCVISLNLPECCLTMSGKTKENAKICRCLTKLMLSRSLRSLFKASTGWLNKFRTRHNINSMTESGTVEPVTVNEWISQIPAR